MKIILRCPECLGRGYVKMWQPGRPETTHMVRCEQCSGPIQQLSRNCSGGSAHA